MYIRFPYFRLKQMMWHSGWIFPIHSHRDLKNSLSLSFSIFRKMSSASCVLLTEQPVAFPFCLTFSRRPTCYYHSVACTRYQLRSTILYSLHYPPHFTWILFLFAAFAGALNIFNVETRKYVESFYSKCSNLKKRTVKHCLIVWT